MGCLTAIHLLKYAKCSGFLQNVLFGSLNLKLFLMFMLRKCVLFKFLDNFILHYNKKKKNIEIFHKMCSLNGCIPCISIKYKSYLFIITLQPYSTLHGTCFLCFVLF